MKLNIILLSILIFLSALSGWLLSKATLIGRTGINLFYKEYQFLKVWWQGALAVFAGLLLWMTLHYIVQKKLQPFKALMVYVLLLLAAIAGLFFTYEDFRNDFSHRLLGERFHLGIYLFWMGCMLITGFYFANFIHSQKANNAKQPVKNV